jgi:hypothetical protein
MGKPWAGVPLPFDEEVEEHLRKIEASKKK